MLVFCIIILKLFKQFLLHLVRHDTKQHRLLCLAFGLILLAILTSEKARKLQLYIPFLLGPHCNQYSCKSELMMNVAQVTVYVLKFYLDHTCWVRKGVIKQVS